MLIIHRRCRLLTASGFGWANVRCTWRQPELCELVVQCGNRCSATRPSVGRVVGLSGMSIFSVEHRNCTG